MTYLLLYAQNKELAFLRNSICRSKMKLILPLEIFLPIFSLIWLSRTICYSPHIAYTVALRYLHLHCAHCLKCPFTYVNPRQGEIPTALFPESLFTNQTWALLPVTFHTSLIGLLSLIIFYFIYILSRSSLKIPSIEFFIW